MRRWATLALLLLLVPAAAQEPWPLEPGDDAAEEAPAAPDPGREAFDKALEAQRKGKWVSARRAFRKFLEEYPDHPLAPIAHERSGDNALLGVELIHEGGPPSRRIDVSVMGDGFTLDASDQRMQEKWAELCLDVLFNEKVFSEYRSYFNFYLVRLASLEEGVDPGLSPEELKKAQERNLRRRRDINYRIDYSTALDCKAAGPQGQVMADPSLVYKWLDAAARDVPGCADDRFVIAFARFGVLGMGGGGIANVGRPDKSVTVHEFGHAFSRLLDEYAVNPMSPEGLWARTLVAANAYPSPEEPKPEEVPWAHLLAKRVKGVGIYEGGATFKKGVWRPARTCAMNIGGNQFCPACREQTILVIYEYVSPIDDAWPDPAAEVNALLDGKDELVVLPMQPGRRKLSVSWYVDRLAVTTPGGAEAAAAPEGEIPWGPPEGAGEEFVPPPPDYPMAPGNPYMGRRAQQPRDDYAEPPPGELSKHGTKARKGAKGFEFAFPLGKLPAGGYLITAEVRDDTDMVVKDEKHLLKERVSWTVKVSPPEKPEAPAPPSSPR